MGLKDSKMQLYISEGQKRTPEHSSSWRIVTESRNLWIDSPQVPRIAMHGARPLDCEQSC